MNLLTSVAIIAMVALQASGGAVRYLCECTGVVLLTAYEHCHGDAGHGGHPHSGHDHHHHDTNRDAPDESPSEEAPLHHHLALDKLDPGDIPQIIPVPGLRLLPVFCTELPPALFRWSDRASEDTASFVDDGGPPSTSVWVTRSVVRLI